MRSMRRLVAADQEASSFGRVTAKHLDLDRPQYKYQVQAANMRRIQQLIAAVVCIIFVIGLYAASILHMKEEHRSLVKTVGMVDRQAVSQRLNLTNSSQERLLKHVWNNHTKRFISNVLHNSTSGLHDALHSVANATHGVLKSVLDGNSTSGIHSAIHSVANATHGVLSSVFRGNSTSGIHSAIHSVANSTHDLIKSMERHVFGNSSKDSLHILHSVWNHSSSLHRSVWAGMDRIMNWTVSANKNETFDALLRNVSNGTVDRGSSNQSDFREFRQNKEHSEIADADENTADKASSTQQSHTTLNTVYPTLNNMSSEYTHSHPSSKGQPAGIHWSNRTLSQYEHSPERLFEEDTKRDGPSRTIKGTLPRDMRKSYKDQECFRLMTGDLRKRGVRQTVIKCTIEEM